MSGLFSPLVHRALEFAARAHRTQHRKGSDTPYISHPAMVGLILQRAGCADATIAAGILHDVIEDAKVPQAILAAEFGPLVAELVAWLSEEKVDAAGKPRPWAVRKAEHNAKLRRAPAAARAIALADKLHNLHATLLDLKNGANVWSRFNAPRGAWLANAEDHVAACTDADAAVQALLGECHEALGQLRAVP